jgi:hypothetical protein
MTRSRDTADQINRINSSAANATAITVDSSENVGIGTTLPLNKFVVAEATGQHGVEIAAGTTSYIQAYDRATADYGDLVIDAQTLRFGTDNGSERMRIDSSGNVLVGTTATDTAAVGFRYRSSLNAISSVADGGVAAYFGRRNSDGEILRFRKDDATVGSIGTPYTGELYIEAAGASSSGLTFTSGNSIQPRKNSAADDGNITIGASGNRFKDAYLSGGVYLGGTGAANKLDDYEIGTHDCAVTMGSGSCALYSAYNKIKYTKVGRLVTIQGQIRVYNVSSPSGFMRVSLPFTMDTTDDEGSNVSGAVVRTYNGDAATNGLYLYGVGVFNIGAFVELEWVRPGATTVSHVPKAGEYLIISYSYTTA